MHTKNDGFESILIGFTDALQNLGLSEQGIWTSYYRAFCSIRKFHHDNGSLIYDENILSEFEKNTIQRYQSKELSRGHYGTLLRCAERLREYMTTGELQWSRRLTHSRISLNNIHESILSEFLNTLDVVAVTLGDISWSVRKYLSFLESQNLTFDNVTVENLNGFFVYCSKVLSQNSIRNIQCYLRKFFSFLKSKGYSVPSNIFALNSSLSHEKKILPALTWEEFNAIISQINTYTVQGKRDYAMFILAAVSGMRGGDIINLRLSDIDWKNGIINIIQQKTHQSLSIPLTKAVGEAIKEYILNGRPNCGSEYVFISVRPPIQKLKDSMSLNYLIRHYQKKANMDIKAYDGKAFHSIRRMVGTNMMLSGATTELTAQVLGHRDQNTVHKYVSLDCTHLKECSIGFENIQPLPGRWD